MKQHTRVYENAPIMSWGIGRAWRCGLDGAPLRNVCGGWVRGETGGGVRACRGSVCCTACRCCCCCCCCWRWRCVWCGPRLSKQWSTNLYGTRRDLLVWRWFRAAHGSCLHTPLSTIATTTIIITNHYRCLWLGRRFTGANRLYRTMTRVSDAR